MKTINAKNTDFEKLKHQVVNAILSYCGNTMAANKILKKKEGRKTSKEMLEIINNEIIEFAKPWVDCCHMFQETDIKPLMRHEFSIIDEIVEEEKTREYFQDQRNAGNRISIDRWKDSWKATADYKKELRSIQNELLILRALFPDEYKKCRHGRDTHPTHGIKEGEI